MKTGANADTSSRPETTLFMLVSADGRITSGVGDSLDPDRDWKRIGGVREGLAQYYEMEAMTDLYNLNTGRVMEKIGINSRTETPSKTGVTFFIVDRKPHLAEAGIRYLRARLKSLVIVTNNERHPAFTLKSSLPNLEIIPYAQDIDLGDLLTRMKEELGVERLTVQSGSTLNSLLLRQKLIDHLSIIVVPLLVGGNATPALIGGTPIDNRRELDKLKPLRMVECRILKDSYIHLKYDVIQDTRIWAEAW